MNVAKQSSQARANALLVLPPFAASVKGAVQRVSRRRVVQPAGWVQCNTERTRQLLLAGARHAARPVCSCRQARFRKRDQ